VEVIAKYLAIDHSLFPSFTLICDDVSNIFGNSYCHTMESGLKQYLKG
jgi:hypothetical protein